MQPLSRPAVDRPGVHPRAHSPDGRNPPQLLSHLAASAPSYATQFGHDAPSHKHPIAGTRTAVRIAPEYA